MVVLEEIVLDEIVLYESVLDESNNAGREMANILLYI